jgi:cellulose synthase/poly-beta-1,6-N-acetylglucosamine synthase-like glycosyltransferase
MLLLTCAALAVLVYTYAGYPILIALAARFFPLRLRVDRDYTPSISAIIPAHNAEEYVAAKLDSLLAQDYPRDHLEILVCSDGSTDGTDDILREYAGKHDRVRPLRAEQRSGKPNAVNLMRRAASGQVLLMTDIRQPLSLGALRALVAPLADPNVGCASGNLILKGRSGASFYWRYENWIRRSEGNFRSMVGVTGPIYAIRAEEMEDLPADIILDDMWIPMRLRLDGRRIVFVEEAEAFDQAFPDQRELGRKVRTLAGNYQLFARLPRLLLPFINPSWFETFSHKLLRLLSPWALIALFVGSLFTVIFPVELPGERVRWALRALLAGQLLFYLGALIGPRGGRLAGLARTFVVLNYAALAGLWRFLRGAQKITW